MKTAGDVMCGRYLLEDEAYADILQILHDIQAAKDRINIDNISRVENLATQSTVNDMIASGQLAHGEIFPSAIVPVVANFEIVTMKWGFPHWKNSSVIINTRSETASEKNMFRRPLKERRCVIFSSGFYEWSYNSGLPDDDSTFLYPGFPHGSLNLPRSGKRKPKNKYLFREPGKTTLYMAGISNTFRDAFGNEYDAFTILTTEANDSVEPFHDRMPVILAPDEIDMWITDNVFTGFAMHRPGPDLTATLEANENTSYNTQLSF
ncbi:MAG: SOS response-associated peptidase [Oscillospiraceae bacterium]|nr:SOS response-associated peptidase [Oscillospiraceae bacterium]